MADHDGQSDNNGQDGKPPQVSLRDQLDAIRKDLANSQEKARDVLRCSSLLTEVRADARAAYTATLAALAKIDTLAISEPVTATSVDVSTWDMETAQAKVGNDVYKAAMLLDRLQEAGKINGNGHHAAQKIAEFAKCAVTSRWRAS